MGGADFVLCEASFLTGPAEGHDRWGGAEGMEHVRVSAFGSEDADAEVAWKWRPGKG
jgi:hypothetical protein